MSTTCDYLTIGAGTKTEFATATAAIAHADQIHAAGWWSVVLERSTGRVVVEHGDVRLYPAP